MTTKRQPIRISEQTTCYICQTNRVSGLYGIVIELHFFGICARCAHEATSAA